LILNCFHLRFYYYTFSQMLFQIWTENFLCKTYQKYRAFFYLDCEKEPWIWIGLSRLKNLQLRFSRSLKVCQIFFNFIHYHFQARPFLVNVTILGLKKFSGTLLLLKLKREAPLSANQLKFD
jgi:hypothetical protein